jgi:16S rRNA (guanine966-N2)-methyltransferase
MLTHRSTRSVRAKPVKADGVRPIGARALKSAIDSLRPWLAESRVLDLFAGQGRFGLATLEEQVTEVIFVEKDSKTASELKKDADRLHKDRARVEVSDAFVFMGKARERGQHFDIIFADPPFPIWNDNFSKKLAGAVLPLLTPNSIFLVKHPARMLPSLPTYGFTELKRTQFGESMLIYLKSL